MTHTEALKLALEALERINDRFDLESVAQDATKAITALEKALAQPAQQEPVAFDVWLQECESMTMAVQHGVKFLLMPEESAVRIGTAIQNTTPLQHKPLTLGQKQRLWSSVGDKPTLKDRVNAYGLAIEAAHGIKE